MKKNIEVENFLNVIDYPFTVSFFTDVIGSKEYLKDLSEKKYIRKRSDGKYDVIRKSTPNSDDFDASKFLFDYYEKNIIWKTDLSFKQSIQNYYNLLNYLCHAGQINMENNVVEKMIKLLSQLFRWGSMSRLSKIYNLVDCNKLNQENSRKIKFVKLLARAEFCNERHFDNYFDDKNIYNEFYEAVNYFKDSHSDVDRLLYIKGYLSIYGRININEKKRIVDKIGSYYEDFKNSNLFQDYLLYMVMFYYYLALDAKVENKEKYIVKVYDIYKVSRELDFKYSYQKTLILLFHFTGDIYGELIDDKLNVELELLDSFEDVFYPNLEAYYYQNYANKKYGTWYEDLDEEDFIKYCKFLKGSIYRYSLYDGQRAFYELTKFLLNDISKAVRCFNKESIISSLSDISEFYSKQNNGYPLYDLVISTCEYIEKGKRNFNEEYLTKFIKTFSEKSQST